MGISRKLREIRGKWRSGRYQWEKGRSGVVGGSALQVDPVRRRAQAELPRLRRGPGAAVPPGCRYELARQVHLLGTLKIDAFSSQIIDFSSKLIENPSRGPHRMEMLSTAMMGWMLAEG